MLDKLINLALDAGYPAKYLRMSMMMHMAPRSVISDGIVHPRQILPANGVVAGYLDSVALAKALLMKLIVATRVEFPLTETETYIDDAPQLTLTGQHDIVEAAAAAAGGFAEGVRSIGAVLSPKSCVVASSMAVARAIAKLVRRRHGVALAAAASARDLGADAAGGRRRRVPIAKDRRSKASVWLARTRQLAACNAAASKLIMAGAYPQLEYASEICGIGRRRIQRMRSAMAMATGKGAPGRCATSVLALALGLGADPEVRSGVTAIAGFLDCLRRGPLLRRRCQDAWGWLTARHLASSSDPIRSVCGPVAALVRILKSIGAVPLRATLWKAIRLGSLPRMARWSPSSPPRVTY